MIKSIALVAPFACTMLVPAAHSAAMSSSYRDTIGNWEIVGTEYGNGDFVCDANFSDGEHQFYVTYTYTQKNYNWEYQIGGPEGSKKVSDEAAKDLLTQPTIKAIGKGGKVLYEMKTKGSWQLLESFNRCIEQITLEEDGE